MARAPRTRPGPAGRSGALVHVLYRAGGDDHPRIRRPLNPQNVQVSPIEAREGLSSDPKCCDRSLRAYGNLVELELHATAIGDAGPVVAAGHRHDADGLPAE